MIEAMKTMTTMYVAAVAYLAAYGWALVAQLDAAGMATLLAGVVTAFITLFSVIVLPQIKAARQDAESAKEHASNAWAESRECIEWRAKYEPIIEAMHNRALTAIITAKKQGDGSLRIINTNYAATDLFGYTPQEFIGMEVEDLIDPKDRDRHHHAAANFDGAEDSRREINHGVARDRQGKKFIATVIIESVTYRGEPAITAHITKE